MHVISEKQNYRLCRQCVLGMLEAQMACLHKTGAVHVDEDHEIHTQACTSKGYTAGAREEKVPVKTHDYRLTHIVKYAP